MSISIVGIAKKAGVSHATVSMALRDDPRISEDRRREIKRLAEEMGYRPSPLGRGLRGKSTSSICILWTPSGSRNSQQANRALALRSFKRGYYTFLFDSLADPEITCAALADCLQRGVDAVVLEYMPGLYNNQRILELLSKFRAAILVGEVRPALATDFIHWTRVPGVRAIVDHFMATGRRRPAVMRFRGSSPEKTEAYVRRLGEHGIPAKDIVTIDVDYTDVQDFEDFPRTLEKRFPRELPFDSLFCIPDEGAAKAMNWMKRRGIRVPEDVAVVGFDNIEMAADMDPPLASVARYDERVAELVEQMLFSRLENPDLPPRVEKVDMEFIRRESAG